jgi:hypothetical protein
VYKILGKNGFKMNPNYYAKVCSTTGLFVFFVKEPLEYYGLIIEKKTNIKNALMTFSSIEEHLDNIQKKVNHKVDN